MLRDSYDLAPIKLDYDDSYNAFNVNKNNGSSRIDHIFVSKQFKVKRYAILTNTFHGRIPSDHYPVVAIVEH